MKGLIVHWSREQDLRGGVETVFSQLSEATGFRLVDVASAARVLGIQPRLNLRDPYAILDRSLVLAQFIKRYRAVFDVDLIVCGDDCGSFLDSSIPRVVAFHNPYAALAEKLFAQGSYGVYGYYEYGIIYPLLQKMSAQGAKKIVASSKFMQKYCASLGFDSTVIQHGVDTNLFKPLDRAACREKLGLPRDKKIGIWVGGFHPVKGFEVMYKLVKEFRDVYWILVFKHPVNYRAKLGNVKIFSNLPRNALPELYNCADFCINPSVIEGFGLAPLEAMACGVPVIASKTGLFWDWMSGDCGEIVRNPSFQGYGWEKITSAVKKVVSGKQTYSPRQVVLQEKLTLERWKQDWLNLLKEVNNA